MPHDLPAKSRPELGSFAWDDPFRLDDQLAEDERLIVVAVPGVNRSHTTFDTLVQTGLREVVPGPLAALRDFLTSVIDETGQPRGVPPAGIEEDLFVDVKPFHVSKGDGE